MNFSSVQRRVVAFVQARMSSSRLPGKSMRPLNGTPIIEWVLRRVSHSSFVDETVLLTSHSVADNQLAEYALNLGFPVFRGSENDVLERFMSAARIHRADHYVRVCADNPLICWTAIDDLVGYHLQSQNDYSFNNVPRGGLKIVDGLGAEILTSDALASLSMRVTQDDEKEHCTLHIIRNPANYKIGFPDQTPTRLRKPSIKLDIDTDIDFEKIQRLIDDFKIQIDTSCTHFGFLGE